MPHRHDRTPIDEVLSRDVTSRDRLLAMIDEHMQRQGAGAAEGPSVGMEFDDGGGGASGGSQGGNGRTGSGDFNFVLKPPAVSSRSSP